MLSTTGMTICKPVPAGEERVQSVMGFSLDRAGCLMDIRFFIRLDFIPDSEENSGF